MAQLVFSSGPDVRLELDRVVVEGNVVVAETVEERTLAPDQFLFRLPDGRGVSGVGKRWKVELAELFELEDDKIVYDRTYVDQSTLDGSTVSDTDCRQASLAPDL